MTSPDIKALLEHVAQECNAIGHPLDDTQQHILFQVISNWMTKTLDEQAPNPLSQLTPDQLKLLLRFVQDQQAQNQDWKIALLNDWIENRESGAVQFIRESYGMVWLQSITPAHLAEYTDEDTIHLTVGDRIEVCNALWEWVQDSGPCSREWFACTVVSVSDAPSVRDASIACTIRFDNGNEFEIQGVYDWNRTNWRLP
ncbi:hypothetical protein [Myxacorys almedinensis]|uniref:Uncharacterized protein n=1 Tax=Myxacorys almedinensis A TaxID=2690445 RepID=A0A8J8CIS2_9CYAN|nr:hypothetical protein [Myxacorys almedinensis]NDJ16836.1 hypothetical protein [Myxacorys almedinensis A]